MHKPTVVSLALAKHALQESLTCNDTEQRNSYIGAAINALAAIKGDELPDTISIHWDNRDTYNRHKVALEVQDAGNLRALSREFVKVVDHAMEENRSTEKTWSDDAVVLFVNKFESLCRSESQFGKVYAACIAKAQPEVQCA